MLKALASGLAGAVALNLVHETMRRVVPHAPRVDVIGTRAIRRPIEASGRRPPNWRRLHRYALAGDLTANALYYSLVAAGPPESAVARGLALGVVGGLGAALLPPALGLGRQPHRLTPMTEALTVAWYAIGGLAAGGAARLLADED
jgi:hypothetical protein